MPPTARMAFSRPLGSHSSPVAGATADPVPDSAPATPVYTPGRHPLAAQSLRRVSNAAMHAGAALQKSAGVKMAALGAVVALLANECLVLLSRHALSTTTAFALGVVVGSVLCVALAVSFGVWRLCLGHNTRGLLCVALTVRAPEPWVLSWTTPPPCYALQCVAWRRIELRQPRVFRITTGGPTPSAAPHPVVGGGLSGGAPARTTHVAPPAHAINHGSYEGKLGELLDCLT